MAASIVAAIGVAVSMSNSIVKSGFAQFLIIASVFSLTLLSCVVFLNPRDDFARDRTRFLLRECIQDFVGNLKQIDPLSGLNIMVAGQRRYFFGKRYFEFYTAEFMSEQGDPSIRLPTDAGVAGVAYGTGKLAVGKRENPGGIVLVDGEIIDQNMCHGLTKEQRLKTESIKVIYSFPIRSLAKHGVGKVNTTGEIIGVVNIDSRNDRALELYITANADNETLEDSICNEVLPKLAEVSAYIITK